jgi:hypothetical protein
MLLGALLGATLAAAAPHTARSPAISLPLHAPRAPANDLLVARHEHKRALAKYGYGGHAKRDIE